MDAAAREAGLIIKNGYGNHGRQRFKGPRDLVTEIDTRSEKTIAERLKLEFPGFGFLGEETGHAPGTTGFDWVVDPLDGTRNFILRIPMFCVSIALTRNRQPVAGVIFDVLHDESFAAEAGRGVTVNGVPLELERPGSLQETVVGYDLSRDTAKALAMLEVIQRLEPTVQSVRGLGSTALGLAYAGAGRLHMYVSWGGAWDVAAGLVIAREGGAEVVDRLGGEATIDSGGYIVAEKRVLSEFLELSSDLIFRDPRFGNTRR